MNKRPRKALQVPLQVRLRKLLKMLSNWQLRRSLQAYNPLSSILATKSSLPDANDMPSSQSCNEWKTTQATYHAPPSQQNSKSLCRPVQRRMKSEYPSWSNKYSKQRIPMNPPLKLRSKNALHWKCKLRRKKNRS